MSLKHNPETTASKLNLMLLTFLHTRITCEKMSTNFKYRIFTSRFSFWALLDTQLINFTVFLIKGMIFNVKFAAGNKQTPIHIQFEGAEIKNLHRTVNGIRMTFQSRQKSIYFFENIQKGFKTIISYWLQNLEELQKLGHFQKAMQHACVCARCFCPGVSHPYTTCFP